MRDKCFISVLEGLHMTFDARFVMEPSLFTQHPDTMLGRMFSGVDYVQVQEKVFLHSTNY